MCRNVPFRMCRPSVEFSIKQAVCGSNDSNDGRNAAGRASVRRLCRHTAHARTHIVLKTATTDLRACAHCARRCFSHSAQPTHLRTLACNTFERQRDTFSSNLRALASNTLKKKCKFFFTHSYNLRATRATHQQTFGFLHILTNASAPPQSHQSPQPQLHSQYHAPNSPHP